MTRLYELVFAAACLPAAVGLAVALAVTAAMWLIRAALRIPGARPLLTAAVRRLLPEPQPREAHVRMRIKAILADLDTAIAALEEHGHHLAVEFRDLYRQLSSEIPAAGTGTEPAAAPAETETAAETAGTAEAATA